jgi:hypothetical protein
VICVLTLSIIDPMGNIKNIYFSNKNKKKVFFMLSIENTRKHTVFVKSMKKIVFPERIKFKFFLIKMKIQEDVNPD